MGGSAGGFGGGQGQGQGSIFGGGGLGNITGFAQTPFGGGQGQGFSQPYGGGQDQGFSQPYGGMGGQGFSSAPPPAPNSPGGFSGGFGGPSGGMFGGPSSGAFGGPAGGSRNRFGFQGYTQPQGMNPPQTPTQDQSQMSPMAGIGIPAMQSPFSGGMDQINRAAQDYGNTQGLQQNAAMPQMPEMSQMSQMPQMAQTAQQASGIAGLSAAQPMGPVSYGGYSGPSLRAAGNMAAPDMIQARPMGIAAFADGGSTTNPSKFYQANQQMQSGMRPSASQGQFYQPIYTPHYTNYSMPGYSLMGGYGTGLGGGPGGSSSFPSNYQSPSAGVTLPAAVQQPTPYQPAPTRAPLQPEPARMAEPEPTTDYDNLFSAPPPAYTTPSPDAKKKAEEEAAAQQEWMDRWNAGNGGGGNGGGGDGGGDGGGGGGGGE